MVNKKCYGQVSFHSLPNCSASILPPNSSESDNKTSLSNAFSVKKTSMELLHLSTSLHKTPYSSLYPYFPKQFSNPHLFLGLNFPSRLKSNSGHPRFAVCSEKEYSPNGNPFLENREEYGRSREDSEFVEVIGIGSRKDAVLDFCLDSPVLWHSLRFWYAFF